MSQNSTIPATSSMRQVECVSCKEVFPVQQAGPSPRVRIHNTASHDPDLVMGQGQGAVCPRCGTDNRHWIRINTQSSVQFPLGAIDEMWRNFPLAFFGPIFAAVLCVLAVYTTSSAERLNAGNLVFYLCLLLAGFLPTLGIITQWQGLRDYNNLKGFVRFHSFLSKFSPTVKSAFKWVFILAVALPISVFILFPGIVEVVSTLSPPSSEPVERIDKVMRELEPAMQRSPDILITVKTATNSLEKLLEQYTLQCEPTRVNATFAQLEDELEKTDLPLERVSLIQTAVADLKTLQGLDEMHCDQALVQSAVESLKAVQIFDEDICKSEPDNPSDAPRYLFCNSDRLLNAIKDLLVQLESLSPIMSGDEPIARALSALEGVRHITNQSPSEEVTNWISNDASSLEAAIRQSNPAPDYKANLPLVMNWLKYIGAASVITSLAALVAVNGYVRWVSTQLPRPIFHSVANMTRVVVGDLKRSLEISNDMSQIQWTSVERNEKGGLVLKGVYREPGTQHNGEALHKVPAQLYTITTDIWGCIESADIQTTTILPPPQSLNVTMGQDVFRRAAFSQFRQDTRPGR